MRKDKITIYLDDQPLRIYRGMKVKNALCARGRQALDLQHLSVVDAEGHTVGLDGELSEGMRLYIVTRERHEK